MPASVRPAMEAGHRTKRAIKARDEAIGPAGRPRLQDPELLDAALLCRLQRRRARTKAGRHPVVGVDLVDHSAAIAVFAQHKFDELAARREQREPHRFVRAPRQPARIGGKVLQHPRAAPAGARRNARQCAAPAFGNDDRIAIIEKTVRVGQTCRNLRPCAARRLQPPHRPGGAFLHEVSLPVGRPVTSRSHWRQARRRPQRPPAR